MPSDDFNRLRIKRLAPRARFELATLRLTAECSTIELPGNFATLFIFILIQRSKSCHFNRGDQLGSNILILSNSLAQINKSVD